MRSDPEKEAEHSENRWHVKRGEAGEQGEQGSRGAGGGGERRAA